MFSLFIHSACISAVILSTETLNVVPISSSTQENASEKPNIPPDNDKISEKLSEYTETERQNVNLEETNKVISNNKEIYIEKNELTTKTQRSQPNTEENIQLEREASGDGYV